MLLVENATYGTVSISGALVALMVREWGAYFNSRRNGNGAVAIQTQLLTEMRDGVNELVQDSRTRRQAEAFKQIAKK